MAAPRKNITILERHGFQDPELSTPLHDEIVMWLNDCVDMLFRECLVHVYYDDIWDDCNTQDDYIKKLEEISTDCVSVKKWEVPIYSDSTKRFCIGFIDFAAYYKEISTSLYFEVKTEIKSVGELFRQLSTYRDKIDGFLFVVCPDDRFENVIHAQGYGFIKYEG